MGGVTCINNKGKTFTYIFRWNIYQVLLWWQETQMLGVFWDEKDQAFDSSLVTVGMGWARQWTIRSTGQLETPELEDGWGGVSQDFRTFSHYFKLLASLLRELTSIIFSFTETHSQQLSRTFVKNSFLPLSYIYCWSQLWRPPQTSFPIKKDTIEPSLSLSYYLILRIKGYCSANNKEKYKMATKECIRNLKKNVVKVILTW